MGKYFILTGILFLIAFKTIIPNQPPRHSELPSETSAPDIIPRVVPVVQAETPEFGVPFSLEIPDIELTANIIPVSLNAEKIVDTPQTDVGWYDQSRKPGQNGMMAFNGHFRNTDTTPGVFYRLSELGAGSDIYINDYAGHRSVYRVVSVDTVETGEFPLTSVYLDAATPRLSLVTCSGEYNLNTKDYSNRTIVYADFINQANK